MQIFCNPKKIWKRSKSDCSHKLEMVFVVDTTVTGRIILEGCRCTTTAKFN